MKTTKNTTFSTSNKSGSDLPRHFLMASGNTLTVSNGEFIFVLTHDGNVWEESLIHGGLGEGDYYFEERKEAVKNYGKNTYDFGLSFPELVNELDKNYPDLVDKYEGGFYIMGDIGDQVLVYCDDDRNPLLGTAITQN